MAKTTEKLKKGFSNCCISLKRHYFLAYNLNINGSIARRIANIRNAVPNFFDYSYDGARGTRGNAINDGGSDMYDTGNKVSNTKTQNHSCICHSHRTLLRYVKFGYKL